MIDYTEGLLTGRNHNQLGRSNGHTWTQHLSITNQAFASGDEEAYFRHLTEAAASYVASVQRLCWTTEDRFVYASERNILDASGVSRSHVSETFAAKVADIMVAIIPNADVVAELGDMALLSTVYLNTASQLPWGTGAAFLLDNKAIGKARVNVSPPSAIRNHWRPMQPATVEEVIAKALGYFGELGARMRSGEIALSDEERERAFAAHASVKQLEEDVCIAAGNTKRVIGASLIP
jgi:hypothetical protein